MKVLIISANAFSKVSNNGKTYEAIFNAFDKSEIAQLFFRTQDDNIDYDFASSYYSVSETDIINKILRPWTSCGGEIRPAEQCKKNNTYLYNHFKRSNLKHNLILRDIIWATNLWNTNNLKSWYWNQKIDIVFIVAGGSSSVHNMGVRISKELDVPLVTFFTDDYLIHPLKNNIVDKIQHYRMERFYKQTIKCSSTCFAIGEDMANEYMKKFNTKFYYIMNSADSLPYEIPDKKESEEIVISYFGGLHLNRWKMLADFAKKMPSNFKLNIYTFSEISNQIADVLLGANINIKAGVKGTDLRSAMLKSDALLHVESDDIYNRALTRLSISTKIPEYLMSGRVVIGYGPQEVASMKFLVKNNIGITISSESDINLDCLHTINDYAYRQQMGLRAYNFAVSHFNKVTISKRFRNIMLSIINKQ